MKSISEFLMETMFNGEEIVASEKEFREFAKKKGKAVFGDKYDDKKMKETVDGFLKDNKDLVDAGEWGELVGTFNQSFAS